MSGQDIYVDHGTLEQIVGELKSGASNLEHRLNQLDQDLRPLQEQWGGHAQQSYTTAHANWVKTIQEMQLLLTEMQTAVDSSNTEYYNADQRGAKAFDF